jgi:hypothetical protein
VSNVAVIGKGEKDAAGQKVKVDDARAALLSLLEPYRDLCSARKVGRSVCLPGPSFLFPCMKIAAGALHNDAVIYV